jgi:hypothetical protein
LDLGKSLLFEKFLLKYIPLLKVENSILIRKFLFKKKVPIKKKYEFNTLSKAAKMERCIRRVKYQFLEYGYSPKLLSCLKEILLLCKVNDIELIGLKFPLTSIFNEVLAKRAFHVENFIDKIVIWDFRNSIVQDSLFINEGHLNIEGAKLFCELLKKRKVEF